MNGRRREFWIVVAALQKEREPKNRLVLEMQISGRG